MTKVARFNALWTYNDFIACFNADRWNVNTTTIEDKVTMTYQLTSSAAACGKSSTVYSVIETELKKLKQVFTCKTFFTASCFVH
ncbi:hypothetical protein D3C79_917590 [compost metagenome]